MALTKKSEGGAAEFSQRLRAAAYESGYRTQEQMADALGVTRTAVAAWWQAKNGLKRETLRRYAVLTNRPVGWFYEDGNGNGNGNGKEAGHTKPPEARAGAEADCCTEEQLATRVAEVFLRFMRGARLDEILDQLTGRPNLLSAPERRQMRDSEPELRLLLDRVEHEIIEHHVDAGVIRLVHESLDRLRLKPR